MNIHSIDPIVDHRWRDFVLQHPGSSIFHTPEWLAALKDTYGYEPVVYTTAGPLQALTNGVVFCKVSSWITGHRLVSLPFSDHCEPLFSEGAEPEVILSHLKLEYERDHWKYIELRPVSATEQTLTPFHPRKQFWLHTVDLTKDPEVLLHSFHHDCVIRKLERQKRESLLIEYDTDGVLLDAFYSLFLKTRRRHKLPPTPRIWFDHLIKNLRTAIQVHVCFKESLPIAGIITLQHKDTLTYKYGASDARFHNLGPMQGLLWHAILWGQSQGLKKFDLGRTDLSDSGLALFKSRWGTEVSTLTYWQYPELHPMPDGGVSIARELLTSLPNPIFAAAGRIIYKHVG